MIDHVVRKARQSISWIGIVVILCLSYGFLLTNPSIGIDDENFDFYFKYHGIVSQGRWGSWVTSKYVDTYKYLPFWRDFLAIILLTVAAVILVCTLEYVTGKKIGTFLSTVLVGIVIAYPITAKNFVYIDNSVEVALCIFLSAAACFCYELAGENKIYYLTLLLALTLGVGYIENTVVYFGCEICLLGFLKEKGSFLKRYIVPAGFALVSVVLSKGIGRLIAKGLGMPYSSYADASYVKWGDIHSFDEFRTALSNIFAACRDCFNRYFSVRVFALCCVIWIGILIYELIKLRISRAVGALGLVLLSVGMYLVTMNSALPLRIFSSNYLCVAGACLVVVAFIEGRLAQSGGRKLTGKGILPAEASPEAGQTAQTVLPDEGLRQEQSGRSWIAVIWRILALVLVIWLFVVFTRESNEFFALDYKRYLRDADVARNVNRDIMKLTGSTAVETPVVFLGQPSFTEDLMVDGEYALVTIYSNNDSGESIRIHRFMDMLGYHYETVLGEDNTIFNYGEFVSHPMTAKAKELASDLPSYPEDGYVAQGDGFIVVKLGEYH